METIFELTQNLWKIIILQSRPKNGNIGIVPFELLWEKKTDLADLYGGSIETKTFFLEELLDEMKDVDDIDDEEIDDFDMKEKKHLSDIQTDLPNVIHKPYGYYEYSELDNSNNRFMRKQENTNTLRDDIFTVDNTEITKKEKKKEMNDLFEQTNNEVPF